MKLSLSICAKELPEEGDYYATASIGDEEIGKTGIRTATTNPSWDTVLPFDESATGSLTVTVCNSSSEAVVASATFEMAQLTEQKTAALDADGGSGSSVIAVHVEEYQVVPGTLQLKLKANDLKNKERGFGFLRKSDPFYQVQIKDGQPLYISEVISNNLCPKWKLANLELKMLYDVGLNIEDTPLQIVVYDHDTNDADDLIGTVDSITVNSLLKTTDITVIDEKGKVGGTLVVERARLVGHGGTAVSGAATQALENAANKLLAQQSIEKCREVAEQCQERATALVAEAERKAAAASQAAEETKDALALAEDLAEKAKEVKELSKAQPCSGVLHLKLRGGNLPDTDGFFNKSDPFYRIYAHTGVQIYESEVIANSLDPKFAKAELDICELTGGDLEAPIRLTLLEQDSKEDEYLGQVMTSVKDLMENGPEPMELKSGDEATQGHFFLDSINLTDYKDLKEEVGKSQKKADAAMAAVPAQEKAEKLAAEEAERAQDNATKAQEAADAAKQKVEEMEASM